jgi:hypothetical protein
MTNELVSAIRERIVAGQSKEEIISAVQAMGHSVEVCQAAYTLATHDLAAPGETKLTISARTLFKNGWAFVEAHPLLAVLSAIPLVLEVFLTAARKSTFGNTGINHEALLGISALVGLVYVGALLVTLKLTTNPDLPFKVSEAWQFVKKHFLALCVIYLFSGLMILGGFALLLIPGLAVMISITFAQYVFIHEGKKGLPALLRSSALVRGRFWYVTRKILAFIFLTFIPMLGLTILLGITGAFHNSTTATLIGEALLQTLAAALAIINLHAMNSFYHSLTKHDTNQTGKLFPKARYLFMMLMGIAAVILIALAYAFAESLDFLDELPVIETAGGVQAHVSATHLIAERYFLDNNQSYAGICESLKNSVTKSTEVLCNDSKDAWALTAAEEGGTLWCADKNTLAKQIQVPLDTRTECFPI